MLMNVLNPSSIQMCRRSSVLTIIGNQVCPTSWSVTPCMPPTLVRDPQNTIMGYSMPPSGPLTLVMCE